MEGGQRRPCRGSPAAVDDVTCVFADASFGHVWRLDDTPSARTATGMATATSGRRVCASASEFVCYVCASWLASVRVCMAAAWRSRCAVLHLWCDDRLESGFRARAPPGVETCKVHVQAVVGHVLWYVCAPAFRLMSCV